MLFPQPTGTGWIEVVCGSMFSGKTEELIRRIHRAQYAKQKAHIFKPATDVRYDESDVVSHSGVRIESTVIGNGAEIFDHLEDDVVVVGITAHASEQLGDIVFVDLPSVGDEVEKDDDAAVIESVKAASDILAPLDGEIVAINEALADAPTKVNEDPLGEGWFFKIKPSDMSQVDDYMDEDAYKALIG